MAVPLPPPSSTPARGRPREPWHELIHKIVPLIKSFLRETGYRGDLTPTHPDSVIAVIGANVITRIRTITPGGVAAAMRPYRNRSKGKKAASMTERFFEIFLEARRNVAPDEGGQDK